MCDDGKGHIRTGVLQADDKFLSSIPKHFVVRTDAPHKILRASDENGIIGLVLVRIVDYLKWSRSIMTMLHGMTLRFTSV
jgi:hypothetical protein